MAKKDKLQLQTCVGIRPEVKMKKTLRYDLQVIAAAPGSGSGFTLVVLHFLTGKFICMQDKGLFTRARNC